MKKIILFMIFLAICTVSAFCAEVGLTVETESSIWSAIADLIAGNVAISSTVATILVLVYAIIEYILGQTTLIKSNSVIALIFNIITSIINAILGKKAIAKGSRDAQPPIQPPTVKKP